MGALEIILNIDDLIFSCFAPLLLKDVIASLEPLLLKSLPTFKGIDMKSVGFSCGILVAVVLASHFVLNPQVEQLKRAQEALCGGLLDFVFLEDALGFIVPAKTTPFTAEESWRIYEESPTYAQR